MPTRVRAKPPAGDGVMRDNEVGAAPAQASAWEPGGKSILPTQPAAPRAGRQADQELGRMQPGPLAYDGNRLVLGRGDDGVAGTEGGNDVANRVDLGTGEFEVDVRLGPPLQECEHRIEVNAGDGRGAVVLDDIATCCALDVELHIVATHLDGTRKRRQRVLRQPVGAGAAAVCGDEDLALAHRECGWSDRVLSQGDPC